MARKIFIIISLLLCTLGIVAPAGCEAGRKGDGCSLFPKLKSIFPKTARNERQHVSIKLLSMRNPCLTNHVWAG
jgi:hypothetical protein